MNPGNLFALTPEQRQYYQTQPDKIAGYIWDTSSDEFERPPFLYETTFRFWYNTEDTCYDFHWHNETELIVPLEKGYTVTVQDAVWHLNPGDIFLIPPGSLHALDAPPTGTRFIFLFETNPLARLSSFTHSRSFFSEPVLITAKNCPGFYEREISLIMQMASHYWGDSSVRQMHIYSCLFEFYAGYTDYRLKAGVLSARSAGFLLPESASQKMEYLLDYMKQHYSETLSLEKAADMVGLSKYYFTRIFKQYTGQTFLDHLTRLRISASKEMLKNTAVPMSRISKTCGYANISSFNRSFRRLCGCTPSEYRNQHGR